MLVVAGAAYLNFIESAVATVIVVLATRNVASDAEIDIFHINTPFGGTPPYKIICATAL